MQNTDTIVALATPHGESAIALIRISGAACWQLIHDAMGVPSPTPRVATLRNYRSVDGDVIDHVLFTCFADGASYTGDPMLEISCHGSPLIASKIMDDLKARGCRQAEPGEFTRNAFLNGKMDLSQSEAVIDIIRARSDSALAAAQAQLQGVVGKRIDGVIDRVLQVSAEVEAYIDFPDEDLPPEDQAGPLRTISSIQEDLSGLIAQSRYRSLLQDGIRTVILGAPNAGKSSLLNALVGDERAIVSAEAGTTRDFIEDRILVGPYALRVIDTAGLRPAESAIEEEGIRRTLNQLDKAEICLLVIDAAAPLPLLDNTLLQKLGETRVIVVENKVDLTNAAENCAIVPNATHCRVSALEQTGIEHLKQTVLQLLESEVFEEKSDDVLISSRHAEALEVAKLNLAEARRKLLEDEPVELAAGDLREAREALAQISGKVDNEAMLDHLFASFCIGK